MKISTTHNLYSYIRIYIQCAAGRVKPNRSQDKLNVCSSVVQYQNLTYKIDYTTKMFEFISALLYNICEKLQSEQKDYYSKENIKSLYEKLISQFTIYTNLKYL